MITIITEINCFHGRNKLFLPWKLLVSSVETMGTAVLMMRENGYDDRRRVGWVGIMTAI